MLMLPLEINQIEFINYINEVFNKEVFNMWPKMAGRL